MKKKEIIKSRHNDKRKKNKEEAVRMNKINIKCK